jgi:hypothetical protein
MYASGFYYALKILVTKISIREEILCVGCPFSQHNSHRNSDTCRTQLQAYAIHVQKRLLRRIDPTIHYRFVCKDLFLPAHFAVRTLVISRRLLPPLFFSDPIDAQSWGYLACTMDQVPFWLGQCWSFLVSVPIFIITVSPIQTNKVIMDEYLVQITTMSCGNIDIHLNTNFSTLCRCHFPASACDAQVATAHVSVFPARLTIDDQRGTQVVHVID